MSAARLALLGGAAKVPGVGKDFPGAVGEEPSIHSIALRSFGSDAWLWRGSRGREKTADLRPRMRGAGARGKIPAAGRSTCSGAAPRCEPRGRSRPLPASLPAASSGHIGTSLPSPSRPRESNRLFLIEVPALGWKGLSPSSCYPGVSLVSRRSLGRTRPGDARMEPGQGGSSPAPRDLSFSLVRKVLENC